MKKPHKEDRVQNIEDLRQFVHLVTRWPFWVAIFMVGAVFGTMSNQIIAIPGWCTVGGIAVLLVPLFVSIFYENYQWTRRLTFFIIGIMTFSLMSNMLFLVYWSFTHHENALDLFRNAVFLWIGNVVVFSIWYWEIDRGGPTRRHSNVPGIPDFLFPQMTCSIKGWQPNFLDYVFLAFNTSMAFSPTEALALSRRAKILMMIQASISLVILSVLAARAVNIV